MTVHNRRNFLKISANLATAAAISPLLPGCTKRQPAPVSRFSGFNFAMCNESMKDLPWAKQCEIVSKAGYTGIEIAPFTLVKERGVIELAPPQRQEMLNVMEANGLKCAGLHWLLAPPPQGLHFTTPNAEIRAKSVAYLHELIDFCGDLGGKVMIFGSPKQRNTVGISVSEAKKHFADGIATVADHAQSRNVIICLEPLDTSQTDVMNVTAEAMEIIQQVNHPAIETMFDFHNTVNETEPFDVLITKYFDHIRHVHIMEMDGRHLGTGNSETAYLKAFRTLRDLGYNRWVSLEVFDFTPGGETIATESMKVLKRIHAKITT